MKNILLVCSAGMSTSLLVTKMNAAAIKMQNKCKNKGCSRSRVKEQHGRCRGYIVGTTG